jgi:hypothetical protein
MSKIQALKIFASFAAFTALAFAQQPGKISGVVDQDGAPVAGALVLYHNVPPLAPNGSGGLVPASASIGASINTAGDGSFAIAGLPVGQYFICAYGTASNQLGSCEWGGSSSTISVAESAVRVALHLREGTLLTFLVGDPSGAIRDTASGPPVDGRLPLSGGNFRIGVMLGPIYARAEFASQQGTIRTYMVAVPKNAALDLIANTSLAIAAASGAPIPARQKGFTIPIGDGPVQTVNLAVR